MNAPATPVPAGTAVEAPDRRDWLRLVGGMMLGAGALVLLIRKGGEWSDWAVFFALLIPAAVLLGTAIAGRTVDGLGGWQTAFLVFGTLLLLASLLQLVNALNGNTRADLNLFWTFGVTAAVAAVTSLSLRASFQMLFAAVLGVVAWLALWDKVLSNPSGDTVRWLLIVLAGIYLALAVVLARARRPQASDLITASGAASVAAAALSFAAAASSLSNSLGSVGSDVPKPGQGWNVFLLVVSLLLIAYGSRSPTRGPGYVGALGLGAFILLTGADLVSRLNGDQGGGVVGWPLVLLIGGAVALVASFVVQPGSLGGPGGGAPPPGTGGPGAGGYEPGVTQPGYPQPQVGGPPPQGGQPGGLLDEWRRQPPPTAGPPPPQQ